MLAVFMVRSDATAEASFAEMRARSTFGIAMAAMIRMIATTIKSSISEKPFCLLRILFFLLAEFVCLPGYDRNKCNGCSKLGRSGYQLGANGITTAIAIRYGAASLAPAQSGIGPNVRFDRNCHSS